MKEEKIFKPDSNFHIGDVVVSIYGDEFVIDDFTYSIKDDVWKVSYKDCNKEEYYIDYLYIFERECAKK